MNEMYELFIEEMEMAAGGHVPLYNYGNPYEGRRTREESHGDGGATGGW